MKLVQRLLSVPLLRTYEVIHTGECGIPKLRAKYFAKIPLDLGTGTRAFYIPLAGTSRLCSHQGKCCKNIFQPCIVFVICVPNLSRLWSTIVHKTTSFDKNKRAQSAGNKHKHCDTLVLRIPSTGELGRKWDEEK